MKGVRQEAEHYSTFSMKKRITACVLVFSFLCSALFVRLGIVQLVQGNWLQIKATDQWTRDLPITATRGKILDATGSALATSYSVYNVYTRAREIENAPATAAMLAGLLGLDFNRTLEKVADLSQSEVLIKIQVEKDIALKIIAAKHKGVMLSENIKRTYPYGDLLTQIIGFTSVDNMGQAGLEAKYNNLLRGVDGRVLTQSDLVGRKIDGSLRYYVPPASGMDLHLTIDSKIQLAAEQQLSRAIEEQGAKGGTAIVMEANTGAVLAMTSKPSFDLNDPDRSNVAALLASMKNQAIVDVYEPGSTFKIFTMASALELGYAKAEDVFFDPGFRVVDGQRIKCWRTAGHGSQTLMEGFSNSCNSVFVDLALRMGTDNFYKKLKDFGFGQKTNIDFLGESGGIMRPAEDVKRVDLARIGFGQSVAVTPLQLITAVCAAVNGGKLYQPYFVDSITSPEGKVLEKNQPKLVRNVIRADTSRLINEMMEMVVSKTGKNTFVEGYSIGGKTGTTQKYNETGISGKHISSFIGTYPAQNPEIVILFMVDEPSKGHYYGSIVASPYAKEIFREYFTYKNIAPTGGDALVRNIPMPNLVGKPLAQAIAALGVLGIDCEIEGDGVSITGQLPPTGVLLAKGQTVLLVAD